MAEPRVAATRAVPAYRVWLVTASLALLAALTYLLLSRVPDHSGQRPFDAPLWTLVLGFVLAERTTVWARIGRHQGIGLSLSDMPLTIGLFALGPGELVIARLLGSVSHVVARGRLSVRKDAFNLAVHSLAVLLAVLTWRLVLGEESPLSPRGWLAALAAVVVAELVTGAAIDLVIWADTGARDAGQQRRAWELLVACAAGVFGLVYVYVASVDWRAGWLVLTVTLVLYVAHRSYATLQRRNRDVESVSEFTGRIGGVASPDAVISETLQSMSDELLAEIVELHLSEPPDQAGTVWRLDTRHGGPPVRLRYDRSTLARLPSREGAPLILARSLRTLRADVPRQAGVRDALTVPVLRDGKPVGTALIANRVDTTRSFGQTDVAQLQALANHAVTALHRAILAENLHTAFLEREHQATHDELTGVANRRALLERLGARGPHHRTVVAVVDLERFHDVNDVLGSRTGDLLLKLVADRLQDLFGAERVARLGSDEFALLLDGSLAESLRLLESTRGHLQHTVNISGVDLSPDVSIGLAEHESALDPVSVVAHADLALRRAKTQRLGIAVYDPAIDRPDVDRLTLLVDLRQAVLDQGLDVHFQPQIDLGSGRVVGFEALARWHHPRRGHVPPDEFIPVAEQGGLMMQITRFVLGEALTRLAEWQGLGAGYAQLGVSVNVSPRTLTNRELTAMVGRLLQRHDLAADRLTLEITETDIMDEPDRAVESLTALGALGVRRSVDDLGTGYSSLAYLSRFPLNEVKIDKSLVLALTSDQASEAVVDAVIGLGRRLGRIVVAEGVEDIATWQRLRELGADTAQGYLISRPMPADRVPDWLKEWDPSRLGPVSPAASPGPGC